MTSVVVKGDGRTGRGAWVEMLSILEMAWGGGPISTTVRARGAVVGRGEGEGRERVMRLEEGEV